MENLVLFVATTLLYCLGFMCLVALNNHLNNRPTNSRTSYSTELCAVFGSTDYKHSYSLRFLGIIVLLCLPININGNVFTILGNVHSTGVRNVYSILSLYQSAEYDTLSMFGSLYQKADKGDATVGVGISIYQDAGNVAMVCLGASVYQKADRISIVAVGLNGVQKSKNVNVVTLVGLSLYQEAKNGIAGIFIGIPVVQKSESSKLIFGLTAYQYGSRLSKIDLGLAFAQNSEKESENWLAMSLYQRAGNKNRAFAVWSELRAD